jgi:hypothetical protein
MRPGLLLVVLDATRAKKLSCYGYHRLFIREYSGLPNR